MKVKEMIAELAKLDGEADVLFREPYDDADEFPIETILVRKDAVIITPL